MSILVRLKPDPIPDIHPMPEYLVTGQRAEWYEDAKLVLQVPWMGVVKMLISAISWRRCDHRTRLSRLSTISHYSRMIRQHRNLGGTNGKCQSAFFRRRGNRI